MMSGVAAFLGKADRWLNNFVYPGVGAALPELREAQAALRETAGDLESLVERMRARFPDLAWFECPGCCCWALAVRDLPPDPVTGSVETEFSALAALACRVCGRSVGVGDHVAHVHHGRSWWAA